jgi:anti-sigma B factor antagonist
MVAPMEQSSLTPTVRYDRDGSRAIVEVHGDLDVATSEEFRAFLTSTVDGGVKELIVNMLGVTYLDSTGLSCFIAARNKIREVDGSIALVITSPQVLKILHITGLIAVFSIYATEAEATAS